MTDSDRARDTMVRVRTDPGDVREINGRTGRIQCVWDDGYIVQIQVGLDYIYVQLWDDEVETCFETHTGVYDQMLQEDILLSITLVLFPEMSFTCKSLLVLVLEVWGIFRVEVRIFMLARTLEFIGSDSGNEGNGYDDQKHILPVNLCCDTSLGVLRCGN